MPNSDADAPSVIIAPRSIGSGEPASQMPATELAVKPHTPATTYRMTARPGP